MSIISLDGEFDYPCYQQSTSTVHLSHKTKRAAITFGPHTFSDKWRVPNHGFYTPTDVNFVITPHISESAGVTATVKMIDASDYSPRRVLYQSKEFNLGHGLTLKGSQLPFCLPVGEYPIQFEVTVSRSQFAATRTMFSTSLEWRMMWSSTPLSRVKSVFATEQQPVHDADVTFSTKKCLGANTSGPRADGKRGKAQKTTSTSVGTTPGLVARDCVGLLEAASNASTH